jgi:hypothetical protein
LEQQSLNLKGKTIAPGISAKHSSDYVSKDEENLFITALNKVISAHGFALPIHVRAYAHFLLGRTTPFTEKDMTTEEKVFLKNAALSANEKTFTYNFWELMDGGDLGSTSEKRRSPLYLVNMSLPHQFLFFLGRANIKIQPDKTKVNVTDRYDMNVHDSGMSKERVIERFENTIKEFIKVPFETLYHVIRELGSVRELSGYKGYPININL